MKRSTRRQQPVALPSYSTAIIRYPSGRYGLVGSMPSTLCELRNGSLQSRVWDTEEEVKAALIAIGHPFFQLADCSWFPRRPTSEADRMTLHNFWYGGAR